MIVDRAAAQRMRHAVLKSYLHRNGTIESESLPVRCGGLVRSPRRRRLDQLRLARELVDAALSIRGSEALLQRTQALELTELAEGNRVHETGFASVFDLAEEILRIRARTVAHRKALHRILTMHPDAEQAFLAGRITQCQLLALAPVLKRDVASAWLSWAAEKTVAEIRAKVRLQSPDSDGDILIPPQEGRTFSFEAPAEFHLAWRETAEIARCLLGSDAPQHRCIEAILAETGHAGSGIEREQTRRAAANRSPRPLRIESATPLCSQRKRAEARELLADLALYRSEVEELVDANRSGGAFDAVARLQQTARLMAPLRLYLGRILHCLETTGSLRLLGYLDLRHFAEEVLHLSGRTAQNRVAEAEIFSNSPSLQTAYGSGEVGIVTAHLVYRSAPESQAVGFLERAKQVTVRQFLREFRLVRLLRKCHRSIAVPFRRPLPMPGLETSLIAFLCGGNDHLLRKRSMHPYLWTRKRLNRTMRRRGLLPPVEGESEDPAENPALMDRLEFLVDLVIATEWDTPPEVTDGAVPELRKTFASLDDRARLSIWLPKETADDLEAAIETIRRRVGSFTPVWVAMTVLIAQAREEWDKVDPTRRPRGAAILKRDRYHCRAPGCRSRRNLEVHHIRYRSRGGTHATENRITLCATHHRRLIHEGRLKLIGEAPHALEWTVGVRAGHEPLLRLRGEKLVR